MLIGGTLAFRPTSDEVIIITQETPSSVSTGVFMVDMENDVCASESPVHVPSSPTTATTEPGEADEQPTVFLMMLEDGVCASLSPISTASLNKTESNSDQQAYSAGDSSKTAIESEPGVWYIQH